MVSAREKSIGDVQADIEAAFARLFASELPPELEALRVLCPPQGMTVSVALRRKEGDSQRSKIRRDANAAYWNPATCEAVIRCQPAEQLNTIAGSSELSQAGQVKDAISDLVKTLDAAERDPRFREFVGIKSFRDRYLVAQGFAWASDPGQRHSVLSEAIDQGLVLRSSVPNPKAPNFPTTSIRINREHPEVKQILTESVDERATFRPIVLPGAPLSTTVLAERR